MAEKFSKYESRPLEYCTTCVCNPSGLNFRFNGEVYSSGLSNQEELVIYLIYLSISLSVSCRNRRSEIST